MDIYYIISINGRYNSRKTSRFFLNLALTKILTYENEYRTGLIKGVISVH